MQARDTTSQHANNKVRCALKDIQTPQAAACTNIPTYTHTHAHTGTDPHYTPDNRSSLRGFSTTRSSGGRLTWPGCPVVRAAGGLGL